MLSRLSCLFVIAILLVVSCKKENSSPPSLTGTWELRIAYNGQGGKTEYPAGNGNTLTFTGNHYISYTSGLPTDSGTYKVTRDSSLITGKIENRIVYNGQQDWGRNFYTLSGDSLNFWLDAYDAGASQYIKK